MNYKNHILIALGTGLLLCDTRFNQVSFPLISNSIINQDFINKINNHKEIKLLISNSQINNLIVLLFSSILPDIDIENSKICRLLMPIKNNVFRKALIFILAFSLIYSNFYLLKYIGFILFLSRITRSGYDHRNIFHSLVGLLLCSIPIYYIDMNLNLKNTMVFCIGYTSHLFADTFTDKGVCLFYPFSSKKFRFPIHYKSKHKKIEAMITYSYLLFIIYIKLKIYLII